ncbi:MAG: tetratricopeptide repeat protein [Candidatus Aminicenantales bacterium]
MKKLASGLCAVFLLMALGTADLSAQEGRGRGRLTGVVVDEADHPLEGVAVTLSYDQSSHVLTTASNMQGQWGFIGLGLGSVTLTLRKDGYEETVIKLNVSGLKPNPKPKVTLKKKTGDAASDLPESARDTLVQANALFDEKRFSAAAELYRLLLEEYPGLYQIRLNLANSLIELQDYEQAVAEYLKVLEGLTAAPPEKRDVKSIAQVYASIGEAHLSRDDFQEAEDYFKKSLEINPSDPALPFNMAEILMHAGKAEEAIRYYEMAVLLQPDSPKVYLKLGYAWLNRGDNAKAVEAFKKVLEVAPADDPDAELARDILKALGAIN